MPTRSAGPLILAALALLLFLPSTAAAGQATGVAVSRNGHILTNRHVVDDCSRVTVAPSHYTDYTPRRQRAEIVAIDPDHELALLRANLPPDRPYAPLRVHPDGHVFAPTEEMRIAQGGYPEKPNLAPGDPLKDRIQITFARVHKLSGDVRAAFDLFPFTRVMAAPTSHGGSGSGVFTPDGGLVGLVYGGAAAPDRAAERLAERGAWPEKPLGPPVFFHTLSPIAAFLQANDVPFSVQRTDAAQTVAGNAPVHGWIAAVTYRVVCF